MGAFLLYGYLKDGEWVSKDWDYDNELDWLEKFQKEVFEDAGDDDWITVVDCHV